MAVLKTKDSSTALQTFLSTGLNSLAAGARALSSAFDPVNTGDRELFVDFEFVWSLATAVSIGDPVARIWVLPTVDGTNYPTPDATTGDPPLDLAVHDFVDVLGTTAAQRVPACGFLVPPRSFKIMLKNISPNAFAASGNTLKGKFYYHESV